MVYILGRLNYSFAWIVPLFLTSIHDHIRNKRAVNKAATHRALKMNEQDAIYSRLDEIPAWVLFPDYERCEWINTIVNQLWPRINNIVLKSLKDLEPVLQQNHILRNFTIKKVDFGKISPRITGIKVYSQNQLFVDEIILDVNLCYFGDLEISFSLNGIEGGIKDIELEGALRIVMKPIVSRAPIISAVQIYFLKHPNTNFELTSALASLDMFATGEMIRSILKDQISLFMVYPNKLHIKLDQNAPTSAFIMPEIEGIVRAHIYSVDNVDGSDIFLTVDLGQDYIKTPIISSSENEQKRSFKHNFSRDLVAYRSGDEEVHMSLYKKDEEAKSLKIGTLQKIKEQKCISGEFNLPSLEVICSKICWLPITQQNGDKCLLQVYVDSGRNIKSKTCLFVELAVNDQTKKTPVSKIEDETAIWDKHFNFFVDDPESDKLEVKLVEQGTSRNIGSYVYNIKDILKRKSNQHDLQAFPLNSSQNCEIVMALKLNFLKILQ
ncbi:extended synaptotagmin-2-like [Chironomus tepperi]|uniref:extended synaptotagmin-2-like n=1 Tax=Chironomus tepperi TaxID=113505 RepID=UPI00391F629F